MEYGKSSSVRIQTIDYAKIRRASGLGDAIQSSVRGLNERCRGIGARRIIKIVQNGIMSVRSVIDGEVIAVIDGNGVG
jgi:hypothetical protein